MDRGGGKKGIILQIENAGSDNTKWQVLNLCVFLKYKNSSLGIHYTVYSCLDLNILS